MFHISVEGCRPGSLVMKKHNLRVTLLCIYMCVYAYRAEGTLEAVYEEGHQNYKTHNKQPHDKLKSKSWSSDKNGESHITKINDKVTVKRLTSYNQNDHLEPEVVKTRHVQSVFNNPAQETRPRDAFKGGALLQKTFMSDTGESTNSGTVVLFKSIPRQAKNQNSDAFFSTPDWWINKPGTILLERPNNVGALKEGKHLVLYKNGFETDTTALHRLKENSDNSVERQLRPSQRRKQYSKSVHRVRKSVNEALNSSVENSLASNNVVSQQLTSQGTSSSHATRNVTDDSSLEEINLKSNKITNLAINDDVLRSGSATSVSNTSEISTGLDITEFVKTKNDLLTVTQGSTPYVKTNMVPKVSESINTDDSKSTSTVQTRSSEQFISGNTTVNPLHSDEQSKTKDITATSSVGGHTSKPMVTAAVRPSPTGEVSAHPSSTGEVSAHPLPTSEVSVHSSPTSEVSPSASSLVYTRQTVDIPNQDYSKLLIYNVTQSTVTTTETVETSDSSQIFQQSTTSNILTLSTARNQAKVSVSSFPTTVDFMPTLSTTTDTFPQTAIETGSHATASETPSSESGSMSESTASPESAAETSPQFIHRTDVFTDTTLSSSFTVTERSTKQSASGISPEQRTSREDTRPDVTSPEPAVEGSSSDKTISQRSSPEPETTETSDSVSVTVSSKTTVSFKTTASDEHVETVFDKMTKTSPAKHSTGSVQQVTLATEANPKQNDSIAPTIIMQTSASSVPETTTRHVEITHPTTSTARVTPSFTVTEPAATPEPSPEHTPESKHPPETSEPFPSVAEPGPDWKEAKKKWMFAWPAHLYVFGALFTLIAVFVVACMVQLWQINRLLSRRYFFTLNLLIFYFCALRAFYLLFDGYNSNGAFPDVLQYFLYSSVFPCLTSAFSILLFSLLTATQMQLVPPRIQKLKYLIVIILFHFVVQILSDIIVGLSSGARMMLFVCQLLYIVWGLFLFCGYAFVFKRLYCSAVKRQKTFQYMTAGKSYLDESNSERKRFTLSLAVKVTLLAAVFGLVTIVLEVYSIVNVYGILSDKQPDAWAWWIYHTALRLTECFMCLTMSYIASQPFRYKQKYTNCICYVLCAPCVEMSSCNHSGVNDSVGWENDHVDLHAMPASRTNGQMNGKKKVRMNETADIVPVAVQPNSGELSRPNSLLIIEDGYVRFQTDNDINKIVDSYTGGPRQEMLTFKSGDGIINGAYLMLDDPLTVERASSHGYTRKSSLASSEVFHPPSSLSLADSMDLEIDKALRNLHDTKNTPDVTSSCGNLTRPAFWVSDSVNRPAIEAYLEEHDHPLPTLRRSRSALGDISDERRESWHQKLFRSRSDNSSCIKTKDLDNQKYLSLLDLERRQALNDQLAGGGAGSGRYSSDDMFLGDTQPSGHSLDIGAARRLLTSSSDSEEIEV